MTQESTPTLEPCPFCGMAATTYRHKPLSSQSEALVEELRLIAVWHTPGAKTPAQSMPDVAKVCQMAADALSVSKNCKGISDAREAAAEAKGKREGIEEAAKVIDEWKFGRTRLSLSAAIRALAEKQP